MKLNYNGLWKILIDNRMNKSDLQKALRISPNTIAKMTKGENVSIEIIKKIAIYFKVDIGDIVKLDGDNKNGETDVFKWYRKRILNKFDTK